MPDRYRFLGCVAEGFACSCRLGRDRLLKLFDHECKCLFVLAPQVPNMREYIAKWGRRVGFDLDVVPTEDKKTHAIIQVPALPREYMLYVHAPIYTSCTAGAGL